MQFTTCPFCVSRPVGLVLLGFVLAGAATSYADDLVISEFLAINEDSVTDEDGDHPDWIEIQNTAGETIDLSGWLLTDDAADLQRWQ